MRDILFLAHRVPWPPDRGDKIRSWHLLRHLARGARVHVAGFVEGEDIAASTAVLSPVAASTTLVRRVKSRVVAAGEALATGRPVSLTAFDSHALQRRVEALLAVHPIDTIVVFSSQMAQYVPDEWPGRLIVDFVDVDSAKFAAYADAARGPMRWLMRREARLLLAHDAAVAARAEASLFVSESEAALFRNTARAQRVHAVENGIDVERFDPATVAPVSAPHPLIVFTGQMDYRPNIDAVTAFADHVLQELKTDRPDLHFAIVGRAPTTAVQRLAERPGIIVTGEVPDTRPWLAAADIVVAPLAIARGVQNKVLEAMAMARPVLASPQAAEGIDHAGTIRVAELAEMAHAARGLLENAGDLGVRARARVAARYGWDARLSAIDALLDNNLAEAAE